MFKAGFSRVDVTPPLGTNLAGYFGERYSVGVLDPIYLNAVAYSDGKDTNVLITADFLSIMEEFATPIRKRISEATGVPAGNLLICALHQHTSCRIGCWPYNGSVEDEHYLDLLYKKFCDVAKMAIDDMKDAVASTAAQETQEQLSFIRRYKMKDGRTVTNPGCLNPETDHPIGEPDNTVRLIRFKRAEGGDIALVNFSTHPDCISGLYFSADWPGFVRRYVEQDMEGVHCLLVNGAQGDTNHVNTNIKDGDTQSYEVSGHIGRVIADTVKDIWNKTADHKEGRLFSEVQIIMTPTNREGEDMRDYYENIVKEYEEQGVKHSAAVLGKARRILNLARTPMELPIAVTVAGFSDIAFVGFGGEPFSRYAANMRAAAPETFLITCCCANGQQGYLSDEGAFAEGGYEADSSRYTSCLPGDLQNAAKEMLKKYDVK